MSSAALRGSTPMVGWVPRVIMSLNIKIMDACESDTCPWQPMVGCLFVPGFGTNMLSVKKMSAKVKKTAVLFRAGVQFLDSDNNLMGYCPEPILKSDLYPLVCTIILGDVARQHAINDIANVTDFLQNNAHWQG